MTFGRFMLGVVAVGVVGCALILFKGFVDQKTLAIKASLNALPPAQAAQTATNAPANETVASAVEAVRAAVLPPDQAARLAPSGCLPGQQVAATHAADFYENGEKRVADYGYPMTVDIANPSTGDNCNVSGKALSGSEFHGTIALADIGPYESVKAAIDARGLNQRVSVAMADLPQRIRSDIPKLAPSMGVDLVQYEDTITNVVNYAQHCAGVTEEQLDAARNDFFGNRNPDNPTWKAYRDCIPEVLGTLFSGTPRGLYVRPELRSEKQNTPYIVTVEYQRLKDGDSDKPIKSRTLKEAMYDLYDAYGVGVYSVTQ